MNVEATIDSGESLRLATELLAQVHVGFKSEQQHCRQEGGEWSVQRNARCTQCCVHTLVRSTMSLWQYGLVIGSAPTPPTPP